MRLLRTLTAALVVGMARLSFADAAQVICWGAGDGSQSGAPHFGQSAPPPGLRDTGLIAAGFMHSIAGVESSNETTVVCWGDNRFGQCNVPPMATLTQLIGIAAGGRHTVVAAYTSEGFRITCFGDNNWGQCSPPLTLLDADGFRMPGRDSVAAGLDHSVAITVKPNGDTRVTGWGRNDEGQCAPPGSLLHAVTVSAGGYHTAAIDDPGFTGTQTQLHLWGDNSRGQCSAPTALSNPASVACGLSHTLVVSNVYDGSTRSQLHAWGDNTWGQCTIPPEILSAPLEPRAVAASGNHSLCLMSNGQVIAWGRNAFGEASQPPLLNAARSIAGGGYHSMAITNSCPADLDGSEIADAGDIGSLLLLWGPCAPEWFGNGVSSCYGDLDQNGDVDSGDLGVLLTSYGWCP